MLIGTDDLGELGGHCEFCGTELRYIHAIIHPKWGAMAVGIDCCDRLTMSSIASEYHAELIKERERRARFLTSKRWKWQGDAWWITQQGIRVRIAQQDTKFRITMNEVVGSHEYDSLVDAKLGALDFIDADDAPALLEKYRQRMQQRRSEAALAKLRAHKPDEHGRKLSYYC